MLNGKRISRMFSPRKQANRFGQARKPQIIGFCTRAAHSDAERNVKPNAGVLRCLKFIHACLSQALSRFTWLRRSLTLTPRFRSAVSICALAVLLFALRRLTPVYSRCFWSRRSCRMSALHGAGSDPAATIRETRRCLVGRSAAPCSANRHASVCRLPRQIAGGDLPRAGTGNGVVSRRLEVSLLRFISGLPRESDGEILPEPPSLAVEISHSRIWTWVIPTRSNLQMETPLWDPISEPAKDLIQRMLTTDVNHRITIQEVLNHKWLRVSRRQKKGKKKRKKATWVQFTVLLYIRYCTLNRGTIEEY